MPVAQYPSLAPPQVTVTAFYTGANAQEVETAVTTPLEQAINGVEGMLYMTSSSTNSGVATINVTFDITRDQDLAAVDVQNRVNQALGRMPAEVRTTGITVQKQSTGFVMAVGVFSEKGEYDSLFLSNYLDVYVKDALKRVPGVGDVVDLRRAQVLDAPVARSGSPGGARPDGRRRRPGAARAERAGGRRQPRPGAGAAGSDVSAERPRGRPAPRSRRSSRTSSSRAARTARSCGSRTSAAPSSARRPTPPSCASRESKRSASASASCRPRTRSTSSARSPRKWIGWRRRSRRACAIRSPSTPPTSSRSRSTRC